MLNIIDEYLAMKQLSPEEERELFKIYYESGDLMVRQTLLYAQMPWVAHLVLKKFGRNRSCSTVDLVQDAAMVVLSLIDSKKFDFEMGYTFQAYARKKVLGTLTVKCRKLDSPLSASKEALSKASKIKKVNNKLKEELGREPSIEELVDAVFPPKQSIDNNTSFKRRKKTTLTYLDLGLNKHGLTYINSDGEEVEYEIPDEGFEMKQSSLESEITSEFIDSCGLTESQRYVILTYYGLFGTEKMSIKQIAEMNGCSKENISKVHQSAIRKIGARLEKMITNQKLDGDAKERANKSNKDSAKTVIAYLNGLTDEEVENLLDNNLTEKEKDYMIRRYGLLGHSKQSVSAISTEMGVSRPSVYEPINRGIAKLLKLINK